MRRDTPRRSPLRPSAAALLLGVALVAPSLVAAPAAADTPGHTVQTLHFSVTVGPTDAETCSVIGDLYLPDGASAADPVPAILTTNGFGGSKDDQAGLGGAFADRGYAVLSYSGLGFGGSGCKIHLDDRDYDGKAASQLVSYLGGANGIAFTDEDRTVPAPVLDVVTLDAPGDPRLGMVGGSYGGAVQYAAASIDPRIDTIVPLITWNDLSYSLAPNNTSQTSGVSTSTSGVSKLVWALGFAGLGVVTGAQNAPVDPQRLVGCPNFANFVCGSLVAAGLTGTADPATTRELRRRSVSDYVAGVKVPTLLIQGEADTLFNLNEAIATYRALEAQGTETKMIWSQFGHSGPAAPGELDLASPDPDAQYITGRVVDWFEHHLKDEAVSTGPEFAYFRDWVSYTGNAEPAFGTSATFPVGTDRTFYLSGTALSPSPAKLKKASSWFFTTAAGLPTSLDPLDVIGEFAPLPEVDLPGTFTTFTTAPLTDDLDVVGSPTLDLTVQAPGAGLGNLLGATGNLVMFVKLSEVGPDGEARLIRNLVAPVRVADPRKPFRVTLPAIAHRFDAGSRLRLTVAGGSVNYRGGIVPTQVFIRTGSPDQALTLPVVD
ncbi:hydrolase CocE/NonD family protein [Aeromicrobium marinum DSM 15272]|uniref:Hydrolase CocE/NonD family protein n=1 Tax=Aeromicrobium marinum DSM 15272 TaxID=585531 RepID=E2SF62_9ACTN|nr:CocE/NonD family hydrolase [Aeromicrobium marinum]EFQ82147.1 hydrolase CocE/NonD family protein [Aeromicrobium marinum DSM 15272]